MSGSKRSIGDIRCIRLANGTAQVVGVSRRIVRHSPTGFEFGYAGSGPADLALNTLFEATGDREFADRHHQDFKREFVEPLPYEGGTIRGAEVCAWIEGRVIALLDRLTYMDPDEERELRECDELVEANKAILARVRGEGEGAP